MAKAAAGPLRARAAFLYLKLEKPYSPWPPSLRAQFDRTFADRWATAEEGRGLEDLMGVLGLDATSASVREGFEGVLRRAGVG